MIAPKGTGYVKFSLLNIMHLVSLGYETFFKGNGEEGKRNKGTGKVSDSFVSCLISIFLLIPS